MQRRRPRSLHPFAGVYPVLCVVLLFLPQPAAAQEYYDVPIEDGGVAFLLDVSGSMDNKGERILAAAESILRDLGDVWKNRATRQPGAGPSLGQRANETAAKVSKMGAARRDLIEALGSLRDGTDFTIITFGERAAEWPGGVRRVGPASRALAREYVASLSAAGGTPMAEALELGFAAPNVRTLFVVSDGRPTSAPVLELVRALQESREGRRMVINTVGIGRDQDGALLCQLALDNEGIYVRDGTVACAFSPCSEGDGVVTSYPADATRKRPSTSAACSSAEHPDCTPDMVYDTMLSEARFQAPTRSRGEVTNCLELERPHPVTIVTNPAGREATTYTRPGHPFHPSKTTRIVKQQGKDVVVETTGIGKGGWKDYGAVDDALIDAVRGRLAPLEKASEPIVPVEPAAAPAPQKPAEKPALPLSPPTSQPPPPPPGAEAGASA